MSTVFDVTGISVDGLTSAIDTTPAVDINVDEVLTVEVQVPGMQGPPGVQNVFPQSNNPAVEFGWGPEEEGFIWLET